MHSLKMEIESIDVGKFVYSFYYYTDKGKRVNVTTRGAKEYVEEKLFDDKDMLKKMIKLLGKIIKRR